LFFHIPCFDGIGFAEKVTVSNRLVQDIKREEMANQRVGLQRQNLLGLPVDSDILFSNHKNVYKKRIEKRQIKLIGKISFIKSFLQEDETILLVTTGCSPISLLEQLLTGLVVFYLKRSLLVFTNKRIFHIPTKLNYAYRNSIAQILYPDCRNIAVKGGNLVVKYKNGKKETFLYIAPAERKKIKALLKTIPLEGTPSISRERIHLCPRCTNELQKDRHICPTCRLVFKDRAEGKKISLVYPGGGYFYTRHPFLGISDAITELILIALVIMAFVATMKGIEGSIVLLSTWGIALVIEKAVTVYHSNHFIKDFITKEKEIKPIKMTPKPKAFNQSERNRGIS